MPRLEKVFEQFMEYFLSVKETGQYAYFKPVTRSWGPEVEVMGRRLIMAGSNDYLGLTQEPRVREAVEKAIAGYGLGPSGTRFGQGHSALIEELEERLAAFVGKKHALVHGTGFLSNYGGLTSLITPQDVILCDKEDHASIIEGCRAVGARMARFKHNDENAARTRLQGLCDKCPDGEVFLVTEGVFSMSGNIVRLPEFVALKKDYPDLYLYLDDAHGLGVLGEGGRGTANHFGLVEEVDCIMGTFSKAFASIGGFVAMDDSDVYEYVKLASKPLQMTSVLPPANAAAALACVKILEKEPEIVEKLWRNARRVRQGYKNIGLQFNEAESPIIPIFIGDEATAYAISTELFERGVFAIAAAYPAVPKGQALVRTAFMSTHEDHHIDKVLEILSDVAVKYKVRASELKDRPVSLATASPV